MRQIWAFFWILTLSAWAGVELPLVHNLFTDHMVVQRDQACPVWGWATPGETVSVSFAGQNLVATAATDGRWEVQLSAMPANAQGQELTVTAGERNKTFQDVVIGDVWLCTGQSNMEFGVSGANQWWNELPGSPVNGVRLYWVQPKSAFEPAATVLGAWSIADSNTLMHKKMPYMSPGFSAIAWFFGREIHQKTGVPIGLIESDQGNTAIQSWSTITSLRELDGLAQQSTIDAFEQKLIDWAAKTDPAWPVSQTWIPSEFDDSAWPTMDLPADIQAEALPGFKGLVWFRHQLTLSAEWAGQPATINLGSPRDQVTVWLNGRFLGAEDGTRKDLNNKQIENIFEVPAGVLAAGANTLVVRSLGPHGLTGPADRMLLQHGDSTLPLTGAWHYQASTATADLTDRKNQFLRIWAPGGLYNGMIAPLAPFAIRGALWYQGEGNAGQRDYASLLTQMIRDWRADFACGEFPFYIVQLAGFGKLPEHPVNSSWAITRELQAKVAQEVPNCGLAVSIDRGEFYDIHPPNKRDVGNRLAALALANVYGQDVPCQGPTYKSMTVEDGKLRVTFDHAEGLKSLGGGPASLAIAGSDQQFVWAQAIIEGETLLVWSPEIPEPVAVRYAWSDNTLCNLYNRHDLPAVPFRTDTW